MRESSVDYPKSGGPDNNKKSMILIKQGVEMLSIIIIFSYLVYSQWTTTGNLKAISPDANQVISKYELLFDKVVASNRHLRKRYEWNLDEAISQLPEETQENIRNNIY